MKLMFVSDIHGSAYYFKEALKKYEEEKCDQLILLGDLLYHGPRNDLPKEYDPKLVAKLLNENKDHIITVRGNCDAEVDQMVLDFDISDENRTIFLGKHQIYLSHGHHISEFNPPPIGAGDILLCGHTHVPGYMVHKDYVYMNPGSVSIPRNGSKNSYMILTEEKAIWKDLNQNIFNEYSL